MGIPEFYGDYLRKNDQGILVNNISSGSVVHSVAIDTPGIIHAAAQKTWLYGDGKTNYNKRELGLAIEDLLKLPPATVIQQFFNEITDKIIEIVSNYIPKVLIIAIDGRVPMAKIQQQRKRRYGAKMSADIGETFRFDSASLSPGTELMKMLDEHLTLWIKRSQKPSKKTETDREGKVRSVNEAALPGHVIYSSYRVPGEAEHKILDIYFSGQINQTPIPETQKGTVLNILYGKDSDLALLALIAAVDNIIVVRESYYDMIDIEAFKRSLRRSGMGIRDYVTVMSFIGDDFLPRQPSMKMVKYAIDDIIEVYKETKAEYNRLLQDNDMDIVDDILTDDQGIIWASMSIFIKKLSKKELEFFGKVISNNDKFRNPSRLLKSAVSEVEGYYEFDFDGKYRHLWYDNALGVKGDSQILKDLLGEEIDLSYDDEDIDVMCSEYLKMFSWIQRYYFYGDVKWDMYYPYHHAPLITDINKFLSKYEIEKIEPVLNNVISSNPKVKGDYNMLHQLLAILPPVSKDLIPQHMRYLMEPYSYISDLYPDEISVDKDGTRSEGMYVYILPFADMTRIMYAAENYIKTMNISDWEEYDHIPPFMFDYGSRLPRIPRGKDYWKIRKGVETSSSGRGGYVSDPRNMRGSRGGRGESSRGSSRGRGESSRGSSRGRGGSSRGRGGSSRGSRGSSSSSSREGRGDIVV